MRYIIYYDPATGNIIRTVQSETAQPGKHGDEPSITIRHAYISDPSSYQVIDGALKLKP